MVFRTANLRPYDLMTCPTALSVSDDWCIASSAFVLLSNLTTFVLSLCMMLTIFSLIFVYVVASQPLPHNANIIVTLGVS